MLLKNSLKPANNSFNNLPKRILLKVLHVYIFRHPLFLLNILGIRFIDRLLNVVSQRLFLIAVQVLVEGLAAFLVEILYFEQCLHGKYVLYLLGLVALALNSQYLQLTELGV